MNLPSLTLFALAAFGTHAAAQEPIPSPLRDRMPELLDQSSWAQDTRYEGDHPDKRMRGVYPVGNGRVFAYAGLGTRANTLQAITGPSYQTEEEWAPKGHFGELTFDLLVAGKPLDLPQQRVRRVRGANFVVTEDAAQDGLALRTLTFTTPDRLWLTRVLEVTNTGRAAVRDVTLRMVPEGPVQVGGVVRKVYQRGTRSCTAVYQMTAAAPNVRDATLLCDLGTLEPGASSTSVVTLTIAEGIGAVTAAPPQLDDAERDARATLAHWRSKLATTKYLDTDHKKLKDLLEDWKVLLLVQRCAQSGAVAPMINHRHASVRDSAGAMLAFLRFNLWDEARDLLRYFYGTTRLLRRVPERVPLDLDLTSLANSKTDWNAVTVEPGDVPSWMILLHCWYWRVTQDTALIKEHWPLLEVCLKKQRRGADTLMTFHGGESHLGGVLRALYPDRVPADSGFVAHDATHGRDAYSFGSGVLFLIAMQGIGELVNGLDRDANPSRWEKGTPESPPGQAYMTRTFRVMEDLEKRYWIADEKYFAPALSPLTEEPHRTPLANANLLPLWVGWTFPTGERSQENLRFSLRKLATRGARVGSTPTVGFATGDMQGMLLTALVERDAKERYDAFDELLKMAEPAGEWGQLYDVAGRPVATTDPQWPNRLRPGESGVNLDAMLFAIYGVRFLTVPNWDNTDIRLKLRLPRGATFVSVKHCKKDGRELNVFFRETRERLGKDELAQNEKLEAKQRRDPSKEHRRIRFRVEQLSEDPKRGYYDVALNAAGTVFVRYLWKKQPVEETEFWSEEKDAFLPEGAGAPAFGSKPKTKTEGATLLFLGSRTAGAQLIGHEGVTLVDTGLPITTRELKSLLLTAAGEPQHGTLFLDYGFDDPGPVTCKPRSFWEDATWVDALRAFRMAGGKVLEPGYAQRYEVEDAGAWRPAPVERGRLVLTGTASGKVRLKLSSDKDREAVLRVGSGCGVTVHLNGTKVYARQGARAALPDADAELVRLRNGENAMEVQLGTEGERVLWVRVSDARGLPIEGVGG